VLLVLGWVGLVLGVIPLATNLLRVLGCDFGLTPEHLASHGPAAMGMGVDWALLSSADGAFLGGLLIAAGTGWRRGHSWAPLVTLIYALGGLLICGVDLLLFVFYARAGWMRTWMMALDGLAFAVAVGTLLALGVWKGRNHR
jgi:hypothetical protein